MTEIVRSSTEPDRSPAGSPPARRWGVALAGLAAALLAFYLSPYAIRGYRFAVGADAPVYLWWARLAGHDGLSAVGYRAGVPALVLILRGTLGLSTVQAVAATGAALPVGLGLGAVAAVRTRPSGTTNAAWFLAGLFAGLYAAVLANGYLSSLAAGVLVLAAIAVLVAGRPRAAAAGAVLLGAAGVTHPAFALVGGAVLAGTVAWNILGRPAPRFRGAFGKATDERRIAAAVLGGGAIAGAGLLAAGAIGPGRIATADTSKDAFLRRAGLGGRLASLYRQRLASNWWRFLLPAYVPLAAYGAGRTAATATDPTAEPLLRRILLTWLAVTAAGVAVSLATGLLPGERFLSFAFALPMLAAAGVVRLWWRNGRGWARPVAAAAVLAVVVGSFLAWWHPAESIRTEDMAAAGRAARYVETLPPGTPVVFVVDDRRHASLSVPRFGNELRGAMPPGRVRDVYVFVGSPADYLAGRPAATRDPRRDELSTRYLRDLRDALRGTAELPVAFVLRSMNEPGYTAAVANGRELAPGVAVIGPAPALAPGPAPSDPGNPTNPWLIALVALGALAVLTLAGLGWSWAAFGPGLAAAAAAPAFGLGALVLSGVAADRLGIRLTGAAPAALSVLVAGLGLLAARRSRQSDRDRAAGRDDEVRVVER